MSTLNRSSIALLGVLLLVGGPATGAGPGAADEGTTNGHHPGFAVVELFTSQGCSSCPPADRVLGRIAERAERDGLPVYVLSLHVDYWNRLGWSDPYSSAAFSERQRRYARALGREVYTPQVVVNGIREGVGSDEDQLRRSIAAGLDAHPAATLVVSAQREGGDVVVRPEVRGAADGGTLWIALSERRVSNHVASGENAGSDLEHVHVVRIFVSAPLGTPTRLRVARGLDGHELVLTALWQDDASGEIRAATRIPIPS